MFEGAIDCLDCDKWQECSPDNKPSNFIACSINRNHKALSDKVISMMVGLNDGNPVTLQLKDVIPSKDPLKSVGHAELLVDAEKQEILGIDIDGDIVVRKDI
ncbi:hypothetical protein ACF0H5_020741 [Mactra antiquata]